MKKSNNEPSGPDGHRYAVASLNLVTGTRTPPRQTDCSTVEKVAMYSGGENRGSVAY